MIYISPDQYFKSFDNSFKSIQTDIFPNSCFFAGYLVKTTLNGLFD